MAFPKGDVVKGVGDGQQFWLPLLAAKFRWSYRIPKGTRNANYWLIPKSPEDKVQLSKQAGFCALISPVSLAPK